MSRYAFKHRPGHPRANLAGAVYAHVVVAETALGRYLRGAEEVHHVNGVKKNNANKNLVVCPDRAYHMLLHRRQRVIDVGGDPNTEHYCHGCRRAVPDSAFDSRRLSSHGRQSRCRVCMAAYRL